LKRGETYVWRALIFSFFFHRICASPLSTYFGRDAQKYVSQVNYHEIKFRKPLTLIYTSTRYGSSYPEVITT
jgi:hypothetical protein